MHILHAVTLAASHNDGAAPRRDKGKLAACPFALDARWPTGMLACNVGGDPWADPRTVGLKTFSFPVWCSDSLLTGRARQIGCDRASLMPLPLRCRCGNPISTSRREPRFSAHSVLRRVITWGMEP